MKLFTGSNCPNELRNLDEAILRRGGYSRAPARRLVRPSRARNGPCIMASR
jgi:hypothetical protein